MMTPYANNITSNIEIGMKSSCRHGDGLGQRRTAAVALRVVAAISFVVAVSVLPDPVGADVEVEYSCGGRNESGPPVMIFNFGDSNSDTGGLVAATGFYFGYPNGRAFNFQPPNAAARLSDGRLIIDFLCHKAKYLSPYLESVEHDFSNGANFAIAGAATLPKYVPFSLDIQILQLIRFRNRSILFRSTNGLKYLPGDGDFKNAVYTFDIGQNDLSGAFNSLTSYDQVLQKIPSFIAEIRDAMWAIYNIGGRKFWVHNTGPLGCLPEKLATSTGWKSSGIDEYGCIKSMNDGAKAFNAMLNELCQDLRLQMHNATIVYVDIYSIKYDLIANATSYGFKNPLMACCGHGGAPYNYDNKVKCGDNGYELCKPEVPYISWDGVHYTDAANANVASRILSANYSKPPIKFSSFFCSSSSLPASHQSFIN